MVPDGKGGFKRVKVAGGKKGKGKGKGKGGKGRRGGGPDGTMIDFSDSLLSTDSEDEPGNNFFLKVTKNNANKIIPRTRWSLLGIKLN